MNGFVEFSYELGTGAAKLVSEVKVNDGEEHFINVTRRGKKGSIKIDDNPVIQGESKGVLQMLNTDGNIYIGKENWNFLLLLYILTTDAVVRFLQR